MVSYKKSSSASDFILQYVVYVSVPYHFVSDLLPMQYRAKTNSSFTRSGTGPTVRNKQNYKMYLHDGDSSFSKNTLSPKKEDLEAV